MGSVAYEGTTYRQNPSTPTLRPTNGRPNVIGVDGFRRYFHGFAVKIPKAPSIADMLATLKVDVPANAGDLRRNASKVPRPDDYPATPKD